MQHLAFAFDGAPPPERPTIVCAGCGMERGDLYRDPTITREW